MEAFFGCLHYAPRGCVGQGKFLLKTMLPPRPDTQGPGKVVDHVVVMV